MPNKAHNRLVPIIHDKRFYNYPGEKKSAVIVPTLAMAMRSFYNRVVSQKQDLSGWQQQHAIPERSRELKITWIGHATFLIQIENINIITDPVFRNLSPLFPRILPPGVLLPDIPPIDFVLISHNHYDHFEAHALEYLKTHKNIRFLVPMGLKDWFGSHAGYNQVSEYSWWEQAVFQPACHLEVVDPHTSFDKLRMSGCESQAEEPLGERNRITPSGETKPLTFTFLPARHWSGRGIFDYNRSLWGSWMIELSETKIYFAGDTAYGEHFTQIAHEFNTIAIACMPIGPCEPRGFMQDSHVNAEEAGRAFLDLQARHFIPMHWGTYPFGIDQFSVPVDRLKNWWSAQEFKNSEQLQILKIGQSFDF